MLTNRDLYDVIAFNAGDVLTVDTITRIEVFPVGSDDVIKYVTANDHEVLEGEVLRYLGNLRVIKAHVDEDSSDTNSN